MYNDEPDRGQRQNSPRNYNSEVFRLRASWEEINEQLDAVGSTNIVIVTILKMQVKRENKNLAEEIKDLLDQLGEGGRSIHELDKQVALTLHCYLVVVRDARSLICDL